MSLTVYITEDFDHMSEIASTLIINAMKKATIKEKDFFNIGLATGSSPVRLYEILADNQEKYDSRRIRSFNLDEYIGLSGNTPSERVLNPESYSYFMIKNLFSKLSPGFRETNIPLGTEIDVSLLEKALKRSKEEIAFEGDDGEYNGKAILIPPECKNEYLRWIKERILDDYIKKINDRKGIDWWIVGTGEKGHIAFHEKGIGLSHDMLLVSLDRNTIDNAIKDRYFSNHEEAPKYAVSMGAEGILNYSKNILLLASGERKSDAIAKALIDGPSKNVPISILYKNKEERLKNSVMIIDNDAAKGIKGRKTDIQKKGIVINTLRKTIYY